MALVPRNKQEKVNFFNSKVDPWTSNASAIGVSGTSVAALSALATAAQTTIANQISAESAFRAAVAAADNAAIALDTAGAALISAIRAKARTAGDGVYELAEIPAPATPSPVGPPGKPNKFAATLNEDGSLTITWKCASRGGAVTYQVFRRATPTGEFEFQANTGAKQFIDATIPPGSSQVTYQVRAVRSTAAGLPAQFNVNFGAGGVVVTSSSEEKMPRIAA